MTYALINKLTTKPDCRGQIIDILLESGRLTRDNPACLLYLVSESVDDRNVVWVQDLWTNQEEHEAFLKVPELGRFIAQARPLLEGMPEQIEIRPVGGKGP